MYMYVCVCVCTYLFCGAAAVSASSLFSRLVFLLSHSVPQTADAIYLISRSSLFSLFSLFYLLTRAAAQGVETKCVCVCV